MKGGSLARLAGMLGANPAFRRFMDAGDADQAAVEVRARCGVTSRAELDTNKDAAQRFHELRRDWLKYQEAHNHA